MSHRVLARRSPLLRAALAALLAAGVPIAAFAQPTREPPPPRNLQVLPKDIPRGSLTRIMRGFTQALGVRCQYCHVPAATPGDGQERLDFALDDKQTKRTARFMLRMVDSLNRAVLPTLATRHDPPVRIACVTCHRGSPLPQTLDVVLAETIDRAGVDSAVARYRELRENMVSGRYDFRETTLNELAARLADGGRTAEAIRMLQMNQEFYPNSAAIDVALGDVYRQRGERDQAIAHYRAALVKQPENRQAQRRLDELQRERPPER
ncbi:MAG TPA: c-type cytochrome [Gemmatimonadaceae bacterium]|nr:c-type cytochrome [Gemmatimonadaceae bacterium]